MAEEQVKEQSKNDKERAQEQIIYNTMGLIALAFGLGYIVRWVPNSIPQVIFPLIAAFISYQFVEKRVKFVMNDALHKTESFLKKKYDIDEVVNNQRKDFCSLIQQEIGFSGLLEQPFLDKNSDLKSSLKRNEMEEREINFQNSCTCLKELLYSYDENGNKRELLQGLVIRAVSSVDKDKRRDDVRIQLYAYLKAWLVCSIRYNTYNLPIEWIEDSCLSKQEQIDVINYIINVIFKDDRIEDYLSKSSIQEVSKYLNILIEKIKQSV